MQYGTHDAAEHAARRETPSSGRVSVVRGEQGGAGSGRAAESRGATALRVVCTRSFNHSGRGPGARVSAPVARARVRDGATRRRRARSSIGNRRRCATSCTCATSSTPIVALAERGRAGRGVQRVRAARASACATLADRRLASRGRDRRHFDRCRAAFAPTDIPALVGDRRRSCARATGWAPAPHARRHHRRRCSMPRRD